MRIDNGYVVLADGTRLKAISGGGGGMGAGAGAGGGGGGMGAMAGAGQNIDWTFGQKEVYDDRVSRELTLLDRLIRATPNAGSSSVNRGQTPDYQPVRSWDPQNILRLLLSFNPGR
jgi:hypothetical protein